MKHIRFGSFPILRKAWNTKPMINYLHKNSIANSYVSSENSIKKSVIPNCVEQYDYTSRLYNTDSKDSPPEGLTGLAEGDVKEVRKQHMQIRAVHIARKMNLVQLFQRVYTDMYKVSHKFHKDSIVLRLGGKKKGTSEELQTKPIETDTPTHPDKYVVYFDYGAVVFFNCDDKLVSKLVRHATNFCSNVFELRGHDEELMLVADPKLSYWSVLQDSVIHVKKIDPDNVQLIAGVLAQTVAMEHYERQVDEIISRFEDLNMKLEKSEDTNILFSRIENKHYKKLFQVVATNNTLLIDLVSKLRVIDRKGPGDAAWKYTRYHELWESLIDEFELKERFNNLNFKLDLIQHNTKFFLEVLGSHRGERLEWYIIILISAELGLSLYEIILKHL